MKLSGLAQSQLSEDATRDLLVSASGSSPNPSYSLTP